jgi:lipopolysaccharide assembly outer membrane protein LptD (OstA)
MRARLRSGLARAAVWGPGALGAVLGVVLAGLLLPAAARAQQQETRPDTTRPDTTRPARADTTLRDTTGRPGARPDSLAPPGPGRGGGPGAPGDSAGEAVKWSARDSLVIAFDADTSNADTSNAGGEEGGDVGTLYGEVKVEQQKATLTAYEVKLLFGRQTLRAAGPPEGVRAGSTAVPRFQRGESESFTGRRLSFNMQTRRGRVVEARTQARQRNAFVSGEAVRVEEDSTVFVRGGSYTTCNCPRGQTPSYSLRSNKMKVQGDWVYTGPVQLFIFNIPMPLLLPFAFLPAVPGRHGGILPPGYTRRQDKGFGLTDFGYYWPINDYMGLEVYGSLWSRGSWAVSPFFEYKRRYAYDGDLRLDYQRTTYGDVVDADNANRTDISLTWNHRQQFIPNGAPNSASLRADVELESNTYRRVISDEFEDNVKQRTRSSVDFSKQWNDGNQRFDVKLSQSQNLTTGGVNLTLPRVSFSQNRFQPFEREQRGPGEEKRWYEKITTRYQGSLDNRFRFDPLTPAQDAEELRARGDTTEGGEPVRPSIAWYEALVSQEKYRRATGNESQRFDFGVEHSVPVSANFRLPRYQLNVTPNLQYDERWLPNTTRKRVVRDTVTNEDGTQETRRRIVEREEPGFFAAREFRLGVSGSTTFYGLFPLDVGALEGLRHEVQPRVSFSYQPDYTTDFFGRTRSYIDEDGEEQRYDIVSGRNVRAAGGSRSINFNVSNEFETKQVTIDSTGARQEETLRLLRLNAGASYNFKAERFPLSDLDVRLNFPVLSSKYDIDASADLTFSPYVYENEQRVNRTVLNETGVFPVRLTEFNVSLSTDLQGGEAEKRGGAFRKETTLDGSTRGTGRGRDPAPRNVPGRSSPQQGIGPYANFAIPWELDLRLDYSFNNEEEFEQSEFLLNVNSSFNLTPKWKVSFNTGYDFDQGRLTPTRLDLTRDFQCWQMTFEWQPSFGGNRFGSFGRGPSYGFNLYVKSGVLRDLLNLRLPRDEGRGIGERLRGTARGALRR